MSYTTIEGLPQILATIHNIDFVICGGPFLQCWAGLPFAILGPKGFE